MSACCLFVGIVLELLFVGRISPCVSVLSAYLLFRPRISCQSLVGFVRKFMLSTVCFHLDLCSCLIS